MVSGASHCLHLSAHPVLPIVPLSGREMEKKKEKRKKADVKCLHLHQQKVAVRLLTAACQGSLHLEMWRYMKRVVFWRSSIYLTLFPFFLSLPVSSPSFFLPSPNLSHSPPCSGPTPPPPSTIVPAPTNAVQEGMGDRRRKGWEECGHHHKAAGMEDRRRTTINKCTVATVVMARRLQ